MPNRDLRTLLSDVLERLGGLERRIVRAANIVDLDPLRASQDWAVKTSPLNHAGAPGGPFASRWGKGLDAGMTLDGETNDLGIIIGVTGTYEIVGMQRGNGAKIASGDYVALGLNGDRTSFQARATGAWTHDHSAANNAFSTSRYIGRMEAGEIVTLGPAAGNGDAFYYTGVSHEGLLTVRRIS